MILTQFLVSSTVNYDQSGFHCFKLLKGSIIQLLLVVGLENMWQQYSIRNSYGNKHYYADQLG